MTADVPPQSAADPNRPHKPADDTEEVYYQGSPLLRGQLGHLALCWLIALVLIAIPIGLHLWQNSGPPYYIWLGLIVIAIIVALLPMLSVKKLRYRISNYRIDCERGLLSRNIDTLELWHVEDIQFHQSLMDRILNVGTITILSHDDTTPRIEMHGLPNPRPLFETLKQRIIAVKRQRGVLKMDSGN